LGHNAARVRCRRRVLAQRDRPRGGLASSRHAKAAVSRVFGAPAFYWSYCEARSDYVSVTLSPGKPAQISNLFLPRHRSHRPSGAGKRNTSRPSIPITTSIAAECACAMRRNPTPVSSIVPSLWKRKSRPGSRTTRSMGEGAGTRGGVFRVLLASFEGSDFDRRVKSASSRSTFSASAMALGQSEWPPRPCPSRLVRSSVVMFMLSTSVVGLANHWVSHTSDERPLTMRAVELGLASSERRKRFSVTFWQRQRSAYVATKKQTIWRRRVPGGTPLSTRCSNIRTWGCATEQMLGFFVSVVPILL